MLRSTRLIWLAGLFAAPLAAQSTGTPVYQAPYRAFSSSETAISFSDPGAGFALEGSYRVAYQGGLDGGFRAGIARPGHGGSVGFLIGGDARWRVLDHTDSFPLDGALTLGVGLHALKGHTFGYIPVGLTLGRRILVEGSDVSMVPYVHPVLTLLSGSSSSLAFTIGFGADLRLNPRFDLRFSGGLGDQDGISFTAAFLR